VIRGAEPGVPGFWAALGASGLAFAAVEKLDADSLSKRLQRNARRT
jgi:hypothetical protein